MNRLLKKDLFLQFPPLIQSANSDDWRDFADTLNFYYRDLVDTPLSDAGCIETIGDIYDPDKTPAFLLSRLAHFFDVQFFADDTDTIRRRKILRAVRNHRNYATIGYINSLIFDIIGSDIVVSANAGLKVWDEAEQGLQNIQWSEDPGVTPNANFWREQNPNLVTLGFVDPGALTVEELEKIYQIVAENKSAEAVINIIDINGNTIKTIYSTDLTITVQPNNIDPGI
jgi:hypothetical protein